MTAPMMTDNCPTEETLAAFVDDRLDDATRRTVMEHLAACGECRELVLMASDYQADEPSNVRHAAGRFGPPAWIAAAAAAAVIAVFVLRPSPVFSPDVDAVIAAAAPMQKRPFEGRVARMPYREQKDVSRGIGDDGDDLDLDPEKLNLYPIADKINSAWSPDLHAEGVAWLFMSTRKDLDEAVKTLEKAIVRASNEERDRLAVDLSTALIARASWAGPEAEKDLIQAMLLSEGVWRRNPTPESAWNRAVALANLHRTNEAIRAWDDYLKLDPSSPWAEDARRKQANLKEFASEGP